MASSSSSQQKNQGSNAFIGIEPAGKRRNVSESSRLFDVFINHRGPDVKETLATQLYNSLQGLGIRAFLDSQEKELGNSFPSTIETAIRSAKVHIAIFSKRYAESPWCLAELVLMLNSQAKIIPVFYQVKPNDLRHIEKGAYADAFKKYEEKGRYLEKHNQWKEALQSLSLIAGEEFDSFSDCKNIIAAVQEEVKRKTCLHVAEYPVGLNDLVEDFERHCLDELVQDFENHCRLKTLKNKVVVVGIFGIGGSGKTTLAKELFNRKMPNYSRASFLFDVREAYARSNLPSLQLKLLKDLFDTHHLNFTSTEEGTSYLKDNLQRSPGHLSFLIVIDDIDHVQQVKALLVTDILKKSGIKKALVIVTTRDVGVLVSSGITVGYNLKGMDKNHGRKLFCWHAFGQSHPRPGYESLVREFVDVCRGLPLSLQVLGRHVHGRAHSYWRSQLIKARTTLPQDVKQRLRISFEALDDEQKQVFMDITCFFVGRPKGTAERVWEASGWNAQHALEALKDKCLVEEIEETRGDVIGLRMHDHLRDLGREMALELSPPHRLWRPQDLKSLDLMGLKNVLTKTNIRCFHSIFDKSMGSQVTFFLGQSHNCIETTASLLWLKLEGNSTEQSSIPSWIPLQNLHHLEIHSGQLKTLWENNIEAPSRLKELLIYENSLKEFPDLSGISDSLENGFLESLEKLVISGESFVSKILISGIHYPNLDSITLEYMGNLMEVNLRSVKTLKSLAIVYCNKLTRLTGTSHLTNLVILRITQCPDLEELRLARPSCLERITIGYCTKLKSVLGISYLLKLVELDIYYCEKLEFDHLSLSGMKCLERMTFDKYVKVKYFELDSCQNFITIQFGYEELVELRIQGCPELELEPVFKGPSCLEKIIIDGCRKLKYLQLDGCQNLKTIKFGSQEFVELNIRGSPELEELTVFRGQNCLERIVIDGCGKLKCLQVDGCQNLKSVLGICNLAKLVELEICGCGKQEFDHLCLSGLKCLERIKFGTFVKFKYFELDGCQNLKSIQFGCEELVEFSIRGCPEVEELPVFRGPSFLERIIIDGCEKLKCLQVDDCRNLKTIQFGCKELVALSLRGCPELENFLPFRIPSCVERIIIDGCGKLKCLQVDRCQILKSVCGISSLAKLVELEICSCGKQEFDHLCLSGLKCLERIKFDTHGKVKYFEFEDCQNLKTMEFGCEEVVELTIRGCPELEKLPIFTGPSCPERIIIDACGKLKTLQLDGYQNLKSLLGLSNLANLVELEICDCRKLEFDHLCLSGMKCLQRMTFHRNGKVNYFEMEGCQTLKKMQFDCEEVVEFSIRGCPELEELPVFKGPSCLERITIDECGKFKFLKVDGCQNLKSLLGLSNLANLVELEICDCRKLEFDHLCLSGMKCLQRMTFHRNGKVNYFEMEGCQTLKKMQFGCEEVVEFSIRGCPELEELPVFKGPSCLERITIDECGKFKCLQVDGCQNLKSVSGNSEIEQLHIINSPELEEVPGLDRLSFLRSITIHSSEKLQNISSIEEWKVSDYMSLCYCSNALIRSCIRKLKRGPLDFPFVLIGRAVDGAESTVNQFSSSEYETYSLTGQWMQSLVGFIVNRSRCGFIVCFVIVVDSSSPVEEINKILCPRFQVRQGEWIITMPRYFSLIENTLRKYGILKGAFRVKLDDVHVLHAIVDRLYHS